MPSKKTGSSDRRNEYTFRSVMAHIAIAVTNGVDYLVTWNFRHIANAAMRSRIERVCRHEGYEPPVICTPNELMESSYADDTD